MISSSVSTSAISSYLVCADGESSEIREATAATYINVKSAAHFDESSTVSSGNYTLLHSWRRNVIAMSDLID
jgi:hypothetical protein